MYSADVSQLLYSNIPFYIFRVSTDDYISKYYHKGRFYSLKVKRNGKIIKNYVPVYRKSDGYIGIYDIVGGEFYSSDFTEFLKKGGDINISTTQTTNTNSIIPQEYQEVEYIGNNGDNGYILTNYTPKYDDKITIDVQIDNFNKTNVLWCARTNMTQQTFTSFYIENEGLRVDYNSSQPQTGNTPQTSRFQLSANGNSWSLNGVNLFTGVNTNFTIGGPIMLFASYQGGVNNNHNNYLYGKIFSFKVENSSGQLQLNLIPCYRKSDGVIGLYDTVEQKFYTNQGTGTFLKGSDVNNTYITYELVDDVKQCVSRYIQPPYGLRVKDVKSNKDIEPNGSIAYLLVSHGEDGEKTCSIKRPTKIGQAPVVVNTLENASKINATNKFEAQNCFNAVKQDTYNLVARSDFLTGTNKEYMFYTGKNNEDFDDIVEYSTLAELLKNGGINY